MTNYKNLKDVGTRSGELFCGKLRLYTLNKENWITFEIDENGDLHLVNQAGETATVNLA